MTDHAFLTKLAAELGDCAVQTRAEQIAPYLTEQRGLFSDRTIAAVVCPDTTEALATAVQMANQHGYSIIPQGGNTGLCGGAAPNQTQAPAIIIALERMNQIRSIDPLNFTLTAEAGCLLSDIQQAAARADRLFPLSYAAEQNCQIGGNLATNAGGMNVLRYGNARDLTLGIEVVLADGRIWQGLGGLRKDNSGYDLRDLFIGAEGTLGIISAATLKLYPAIRDRATALVGLNSAQAAVDCFAQLRADSGDTLTSCELMGRRPLAYAIDAVEACAEPFTQSYAWYLLVELSSSAPDTDLAGRLAQSLSAQKTRLAEFRLAHDAEQAAAFWHLRNSIPGAQRHAGASIKNDIAVPLSAIAEFIAQATEAVEQACPGTRVCAFGHVGDGNLHFNLTQPQAMSRQAFLARWTDLTGIVHDIVMRYPGSFAAEHGIGQLKVDEITRLKSPVEQALMRSLKDALDPENRLNPGKMIAPRRDDA